MWSADLVAREKMVSVRGGTSAIADEVLVGAVF